MVICRAELKIQLQNDLVNVNDLELYEKSAQIGNVGPDHRGLDN